MSFLSEGRIVPRFLVGITILLMSLTACSVGRMEPSGETTDDEGSVGAAINLHGSSEEALLERGKQSVMNARFKDAAALFTELSGRDDADPKYRAAALFELGEVYTNLLNPGRDPNKALEVFRRLIRDYPDSPRREDAEAHIERLQPEAGDGGW